MVNIPDKYSGVPSSGVTTPEGGGTSPTSFIQPVSKHIDVVDPQSSVSNDYAGLPIVNKQLSTHPFITTQKKVKINE